MSRIDHKKIISDYIKTKSIWKAGHINNIAGQTVHKILKLNGVDCLKQKIPDSKLEKIRQLYLSGFERGDGKLDALCKEVGIDKPNVSREARKMGFTSCSRKVGDNERKRFIERAKGQWERNPHPRGMLGKKHTPQALRKMSDASTAHIKQWKESGRMSAITLKGLKTRASNGTLVSPRHGSWKQAWHEVGGKRFYARSSWEFEYAKILELRKKIGAIAEWHHEPDTFWFDAIKRGCRSYTPDFRVHHVNGDVEYHEIKGWMDARSKTKIKRMAIYHKNIKLVVIDSKAYKAIKARGI